MKKLLSLPLLIISLTAFADTITIPKTGGEWYYPASKPFPAKPGDVVKMDGIYTSVVIYDKHLGGVTFLGNGSKVTGKVSIHNSTGFILDGWKIGGTPGNFNETSYNFGGSSNFAFINSEVSWAKIGPYSNYVKGSFPNITFDNNYIHDIGSADKLSYSEGFYIGPSDGSNAFSFPNMVISNNRLENIGGDGIQVSNSPGVKVFNNKIKNYGFHNIKYQQNGIGLGSFTSGIVKDNLLTTGTGAPFNAMGNGETIFEGNTATDCALSSNQDIFYIRGPQVRIINNTANRTSRNWIKVDAGSVIEDRGNKFGVPIPPVIVPPVRVDSVSKAYHLATVAAINATCKAEYDAMALQISQLKAEIEALKAKQLPCEALKIALINFQKP